jgi:hypothetical protein
VYNTCIDKIYSSKDKCYEMNQILCKLYAGVPIIEDNKITHQHLALTKKYDKQKVIEYLVLRNHEISNLSIDVISNYTILWGVSMIGNYFDIIPDHLNPTKDIINEEHMEQIVQKLWKYTPIKITQ